MSMMRAANCRAVWGAMQADGARGSHRGQALSYDAIGGVVIFAIAIGILFAYWSSMSASFSDEDAMLVLEANTAIDRILSKDMLLSNEYEINKTRLTSCDIDKDAAGLAHDYFFALAKQEGGTLVPIGQQCSSRDIDGKPYPPQNPRKIVRSERIVFYDGEPAKAVLAVYIE
ncbi:MAG: hypothetical protein QXU54_00585 [Candidatus Micrarchaeia archaeon]